MDKFRVKVVMLNQPRWSTLQQRLDEFRLTWYRAKNAPFVEVAYDYEKFKGSPKVDAGRLSFLWIDNNISIEAKKSGYDAVGVIVTTADAKRWGLNPKIRGTYYRDNDGILEFYVVADENETYTYPNGMKVNRFLKTFTHEMLHAVTHFSGYPDRTHYWDYEQYDVFKGYTEIDWRVVPLWQKVLRLKQELLAKLKRS